MASFAQPPTGHTATSTWDPLTADAILSSRPASLSHLPHPSILGCPSPSSYRCLRISPPDFLAHAARHRSAACIVNSAVFWADHLLLASSADLSCSALSVKRGGHQSISTSLRRLSLRGSALIVPGAIPYGQGSFQTPFIFGLTGIRSLVPQRVHDPSRPLLTSLFKITNLHVSYSFIIPCSRSQHAPDILQQRRLTPHFLGNGSAPYVTVQHALVVGRVR